MSCSFFSGPDYDYKADGSAILLNGVDDYLKVSSNLLPEQGDYTISLWVKIDSTVFKIMSLLYQEDTLGNKINFSLETYSDKTLKFLLGDKWSIIKDKTFILDGKWHLLTLVNDGEDEDSTINDTSYFYMDDKRIGTLTSSFVDRPQNENFYIGSDSSGKNNNYSGVLDHVMVWKKKLSFEEIRGLYNDGQGLNPTLDSLTYESSSDLHIFLPMVEGADSIANDYSGNDYLAILDGPKWSVLVSKLDTKESLENENINQKEIWGSITNSRNKPISKAKISVSGQRKGKEFNYNLKSIVKTTSRGDYEIQNYLKSDTLSISKNGYKTVSIPLNDLEIDSLPNDFELEIDRTNEIQANRSKKKVEQEQNALDNYELIQDLVSQARDNEVITLPIGSHIISKSIIINNKKNITIKSDSYTRLSSIDGKNPVFKIINSDNVVINNLQLSHSEFYGKKSNSEILNISESRRIYINNSELGGFGSIGIKAVNSDQIAIVSCYVHDNSWFAFSFQKCKNVRIENSRIVKNKELLFRRGSEIAMFSNNIKN